MKAKARFTGASRSLDDELIVSFAVEDIGKEELESLKEQELMLDVEKYRKHRSLSANAYFWKLCDEIAKKLKSDKETIYLMKLKDAGVFDVIDVVEAGKALIEPLYRYVEEKYSYSAMIINPDGEEIEMTMLELHCYKGSHEYDSKQMSDLIESTVQEAQDLGIETMTHDEIEHICSLWRAR